MCQKVKDQGHGENVYSRKKWSHRRHFRVKFCLVIGSAFHISWSKCSLSVCLSVCVDICLPVNQGGTNCNRCTQRLVISHAQAYRWTLITHPKQGQPDLLSESQLPTDKNWWWIDMWKPSERHSPWAALYSVQYYITAYIHVVFRKWVSF